MTKFNNIDTIFEAMEFDQQIKENELTKKKVDSEVVDPQIGDFVKISLPSGERLGIITMSDTGIDGVIRCALVRDYEDPEDFTEPYDIHVGGDWYATRGHTFPICVYRCKNSGIARGVSDPKLDEILSECIEYDKSDNHPVMITIRSCYEEELREQMELTTEVSFETWALIPE